jgi:proline iminopeptidase
MHEKPTVLLLHGGPGFDHSIYKPAYSALADVAQVIYLEPSRQWPERRRAKEAWDAGAMGR